MPTATTAAPRIRRPPPARKENWSSAQLKIAGSSETISSGTTKTSSRSRRSPFPSRPRRYDTSAATAKMRAAMRPAVRRGVRPMRSGCGLVQRRGAPLRHGVDDVLDDPILMVLDDAEHRLDQRLGEECRLQAQLEQLRVRRVVVVLLELVARVGDVVDLDVHAHLAGGMADL